MSVTDLDIGLPHLSNCPPKDEYYTSITPEPANTQDDTLTSFSQKDGGLAHILVFSQHFCEAKTRPILSKSSSHVVYSYTLIFRCYLLEMEREIRHSPIRFERAVRQPKALISAWLSGWMYTTLANIVQ